VLGQLRNIELTLVIGRYALDWHLADRQAKTLTETVKNWQGFWPTVLPLPHPSPRNMMWMRKNPWFPTEILPRLQERVADLLAG
jgi:uracil-DNA glycosylase